MSSVHILQLYDDCLYHIFEYLGANDRRQFGNVCKRFKQVFISQLGKRYRNYSLNPKSDRLELLDCFMCCEIVERLHINLSYLEIHSIIPIPLPSKLFTIILGGLMEMKNLRYLIIQDNTERTPRAAGKPFEQILTAVTGLNKLKGLEIHAKEACSLENLKQLHHLEELHLHIPQIGTPTLVKCCQSNSNLRVLYLSYGCIKKNLHHIVPHCKNLEALTFGLSAEESNYTPLANLNKLRELTYSGIRKSGSFQPLLKELAIKSQLERLVISGVSLNLQEMEQIVQIDSLLQLKCFCSSIQSVEMLTNLTKLEELCLWMSTHEDISNALLKIIINCSNLRIVRVAAGNIQRDFNTKVQKLRIGQMPILEIPFLDQTSDEVNPTDNKIINWSAF